MFQMLRLAAQKIPTRLHLPWWIHEPHGLVSGLQVKEPDFTESIESISVTPSRQICLNQVYGDWVPAYYFMKRSNIWEAKLLEGFRNSMEAEHKNGVVLKWISQWKAHLGLSPAMGIGLPVGPQSSCIVLKSPWMVFGCHSIDLGGTSFCVCFDYWSTLLTQAFMDNILSSACSQPRQ